MDCVFLAASCTSYSIVLVVEVTEKFQSSDEDENDFRFPRLEHPNVVAVVAATTITAGCQNMFLAIS